MTARTALGCLTVVALLAGCGGEPPAPAGSPDNPLKARPASTEKTSAREPGSAAATTKPGYKALLKRQPQQPGHRFSPCSLVTQAQARAILGGRVQLPTEAPQGPTCIYRTAKGDGFVTIAVENTDFARAKSKLRKASKVELGSRTGICGQYGRPTLYAPLSQGRVLTVGADCGVAKQFAAHAVRSLGR